MRIKNFDQAQRFLLKYLPRTDPLLFPGVLGVKRTEMFLKLLGNPQDKTRVIHIAGTSGKGSTAYLISSLLREHGFKVGLTLSPHVEDIRERCQINNQVITKELFLRYLNNLVSIIEKMKKTKFGLPTYFEFLVALAFYIFWKERVDYAVVETGLGGALDATNVVHSRNKLCIITRIGKDHVKILGNTLKDIAQQKAGIIHKENSVIALFQRKEINDVVQKRIKKVGAKIFFVKKGKSFSNVSISEKGTIFDYRTLKQIKLGMIGEFQAENAGLSLSAFWYLSARDKFDFNEKKIRRTLKTAHFPGRVEIIKTSKKIIIVDGAHNPQKMTEFVRTLKKLYPEKKFTFLVAWKRRKDYVSILQKIVPLAKQIILTDFFATNRNLVWMYQKEKKIRQIFRHVGFRSFCFINDQKKALKMALSDKNNVIITGSLYFVGEIYPFIKKIKK